MIVDSGNNLVTGEIFNIHISYLYVSCKKINKKNLCAIENVSKLIKIHDFLPTVTASSNKDRAKDNQPNHDKLCKAEPMQMIKLFNRICHLT